MVMNTAQLKELSTTSYWDTRYTTEQRQHEDKQAAGDTEEPEYEWFRTFEQVRPFLKKHLPPASSGVRILQLGCGTSTLTTDLHALGYRNQCSIDFSPVAIDAMKAQHAVPGYAELEWRVMDVRRMELESGGFGVAIDKGTLDAMLYGSLWDPEEEVKMNVGAYVDEVARVLEPGGMWLYITYRQPHFMKPLLAREGVWEVAVESLEAAPGMFEYFGFVMTKGR